MVEYIIKCKPLDFANLNVNEIAKVFKVSVPHLSRAFKQEQGINLKEFIFREKINCSRFLLIQNKRLTIKDISNALDFCSCDYFIQVFKKYVGITPGKYRKINGGFYGLNDRRKGPDDRRSGIKDRRNNYECKKISLLVNIESSIQPSYIKEHRKGPMDRRKGPSDRRKSLPKPFKLSSVYNNTHF